MPLEGDLLDPIGGGVLVGYARVSTRDQKLARQVDALFAAGCRRVFQEKLSGRNAARPELKDCLEFLCPGDTLVVLELSRLGRSLQDLITIVGDLRRRGIGFISLHENLDTTTPGGRLVFHVFATLAEFIRELIVEGTREGLDSAKARGVRLGRPPAMSDEQVRQARALLTEPEATLSSIARLLGVSRATIYKYVPELADRGRGDAACITAEPVAPVRVLSAVPAPAKDTAPAGGEDGQDDVLGGRRPVRARVFEPVDPQLRERLQRAARRPVRCPSCGHEPVEVHERDQQRQDLAITWLALDPAHPGELAEQHHCARCQPHQHFQAISCPLCTEGPIVTGTLADQITDPTAPPEPLYRWLLGHGWYHDPDDGLTCPNHRRTPAGEEPDPYGQGER